MFFSSQQHLTCCSEREPAKKSPCLSDNNNFKRSCEQYQNNTSNLNHQVFGHTIFRHHIKWDHFEILASGKNDYCKIKETFFIQELNPTLIMNIQPVTSCEFIVFDRTHTIFYKGLNITSAETIFPLANVYHKALGRRSNKNLQRQTTYRRLFPESKCRCYGMLGLLFEPT